MKTPIVLWIVGVVALFAGMAMYAMSWYQTIGLGEVVVGIVLLVSGGIVMARERKPAIVPPKPQ